MGYTYNHDLGTKEMQEALGLSDDQIINKFNVPEGAECDTALRELVDAGCNIIFATSFGFEDYVKEVAAEYPDIQFCHATGFQAKAVSYTHLKHIAFSCVNAYYGDTTWTLDNIGLYQPGNAILALEAMRQIFGNEGKICRWREALALSLIHI